MKLEIGMYVRFKKGKITYVRQLLEVIHNYEEFDVYRTAGEYFDYEEKDYFDIVYPNEIIGKPSYNIIDLIEKRDYVNGIKITLIHEPSLANCNKRIVYAEDEKGYLIEMFDENDIKSIVTHEQFESMKYEVE